MPKKSAPAKATPSPAPDKLTVVYRKTSSLIPYARNARTHSDAQVAQIAASIREFGFTSPILLDGRDGILAGHGRTLAASLLGLEEVPTIDLAHLTETQRRAYILADNKLALNAGWDEELLKLELHAITEAEFPLEILGFTPSELSVAMFDDPPAGDAGSNTALPADIAPAQVKCPRCAHEFAP